MGTVVAESVECTEQSWEGWESHEGLIGSEGEYDKGDVDDESENGNKSLEYFFSKWDNCDDRSISNILSIKYSLPRRARQS